MKVSTNNEVENDQQDAQINCQKSKNEIFCILPQLFLDAIATLDSALSVRPSVQLSVRHHFLKMTTI